MGIDSIRQLCVMYAYDEEVILDNFKIYKSYVLNNHNQESVPTNLKQVVMELFTLQHNDEYLDDDVFVMNDIYNIYSHLLTAMNHAMWLEQWNSLSAMFTGGKRHETKADTLLSLIHI